MINRRISAAEAAQHLGIKTATLYSYVSRGLLQRERTPHGSTFDLHEVARLARTSRNSAYATVAPSRGRPGLSEEPVFITELTLIEDGRLFYRGEDAVHLSRTRRFEEVAEWLWTGTWPQGDVSWECSGRVRRAVSAAAGQLGSGASLVERIMVGVLAASLADDLRHDLNPAGVPVTGRGLLTVLLEALPVLSPTTAPAPSFGGRLWERLVPEDGTEAATEILDAALVLCADHELAPSTLAARVAAAFRADPYAAVLTGLGPASGSWHAGSSGAPSEVEALLSEAAEGGAEAAVGARLRRSGSTPHGFGMSLYPEGDPRGAELLRRVLDLSGCDDRVSVVAEVVQLGDKRGFPPPNVDLGLGALSFCAGMTPGAGQAILTLGKMAGWLAHVTEEYRHPTIFRSRADYVGTRPVSTSLPAGPGSSEAPTPSPGSS